MTPALQFIIFVMIAIQPLQLNFRIRTEESNEYSLSSYDFSALRDSVQSIQLAEDCISHQIYHFAGIPDVQVESARSTDHSSRSSDEVKYPEIRRSLNIQPSSTKLHSIQSLPPTIIHKLLSFKKCPNLARNDVQNRAYGAMFGVIIGDALGAYVINKIPSADEIANALLMEGGGVMGLLPGEGSDEWELNVALAEGLLAGRGSYHAKLIAQKYLEWIQSSPRDMPVLVGIALSQLRKRKRELASSKVELDLGEQLLKGSKKNCRHESPLGLVRILPLVLWGLNLEDDQFQWLVRMEMQLICPNQFSIQIAILYAKLLKTLIITGEIATAYHDAACTVAQRGSSELVNLWSSIQQNRQPLMNSGNANNIRFPFFFAIKQLVDLSRTTRNAKKQYINAAVRVLSRGFNTDTNCSIALGLVGAALGYNCTPNYMRDKILNGSKDASGKRSRDYWSGRVVDLVNNLLKEGPIFLDQK